jgi:hypothetical protein
MAHYILHYDWKYSIAWMCYILFFCLLIDGKFGIVNITVLNIDFSKWTSGFLHFAGLANYKTDWLATFQEILSVYKESQKCRHKPCSAEIQYCLPTITQPKVTKQNCHLTQISVDIWRHSKKATKCHNSGDASFEMVGCQRNSKKRGVRDNSCWDT